MYLPTNMGFISAVDQEMTAQEDKIDSLEPIALTEFKHHVTLMQMASLPDARSQWFSIKDRIGQDELTIRSDSYLMNNQGEKVLLCNIFDRDGKDVSDQYVFSGLPHITWSLKDGRKPIESLDIIKAFKEGKGNFKEVQFKEPMEFSAVIATEEKGESAIAGAREVNEFKREKKGNKGNKGNKGK
jgi:hypothetical protein